jgi:hypothetical protein
VSSIVVAEVAKTADVNIVVAEVAKTSDVNFGYGGLRTGITER